MQKLSCDSQISKLHKQHIKYIRDMSRLSGILCPHCHGVVHATSEVCRFYCVCKPSSFNGAVKYYINGGLVMRFVCPARFLVSGRSYTTHGASRVFRWSWACKSLQIPTWFCETNTHVLGYFTPGESLLESPSCSSLKLTE